MRRLKIDYGIDLGTTNSSICRMESGVPVICKTDTLKDTMPSCVSINKKGSIKVGDGAFNTMKSDKRRATKSWDKSESNTFVEFKRDMGSDKDHWSSFAQKNFTAEELSSNVLKTLKSFYTDHQIPAVVITVPAKFTVNQKTATMKAAKLAGFQQCELLQEPIAAAYAYGLKADSKNGYWLVFDFGGGTFDAALVKIEDGIMEVFDTEGDNYLGGKNLDEEIVNQIIIPYLKANYCIDDILSSKSSAEVLREAMKTYAEDVKNQLSFKESEDIISNLGDLGEDDLGEEIEIDLTVTQEQLNNAIISKFQKAVDICLALLSRNNLSGEDLDSIILVGGPTYSPLLRKMLREQIADKLDTSINPMTAVATGAALYASTIDSVVNSEIVIDEQEVQFELGYESTTVEETEWISLKLDKIYSTKNNVASVIVEIVRADNGWASGKVEINTIGDVIELALLPGKANAFNLYAYDPRGNKLNCFPSQFSIIQGAKVSTAPLPYHIGVAVWDDERKREVFQSMCGLEKNRSVPATGVLLTKKTSSVLRPGYSSDLLTIPVYQVDDNPHDGQSVSLYEYVADIVISGNEIDREIPADSAVEVTLKVNSSEMMDIEVFFPAYDITLTKKLDTSKHQVIDEAEKMTHMLLERANEQIEYLRSEGFEMDVYEEKLSTVRQEAQNSTDYKATLQHVKEVARQIEEKELDSEWPIKRKALETIIVELEKVKAKQSDPKVQSKIEESICDCREAIQTQDISVARRVEDSSRNLLFKLSQMEILLAIIANYHFNFDKTNWSDPDKAVGILNQVAHAYENEELNEGLALHLARELVSLDIDFANRKDTPENLKGLLQ